MASSGPYRYNCFIFNSFSSKNEAGMNGLLRNARVGEQQFRDGFALAQFLQNKMHRNARAFDDRLTEQDFRVGGDVVLPVDVSHGFELLHDKYRRFFRATRCKIYRSDFELAVTGRLSIGCDFEGKLGFLLSLIVYLLQ